MSKKPTSAEWLAWQEGRRDDSGQIAKGRTIPRLC